MKKLLFFIVLAASSVCAQTAEFELTPAGFVSSSEPSQDYLVIEAPGKDKAALYKEVLAHLYGSYTNPDAALSLMDGELITVNGAADNAVRRNSMHVFDMNYTYTIRFKDEKVRIDSPSFKLTTYTDQPQELHLVFTGFDITGSDLGIYGKKDKLKSKKAKEDLEEYFNKEASGIVAAIHGKQDW